MRQVVGTLSRVVMKANIEGFADPIVAEDLPEEQWFDLRRQHALVKRSLGKVWLFKCVDCGHPLYPSVSRLKNRFFAHRPDSSDACALRALDGESPEHRRLKVEIYKAIKQQREWEGEIEAKAPDPDPLTGKPIIVDVVARRRTDNPDPRRLTPPLQGWEVQLSPLGDGQALDRQERRHQWLNRCNWVTESRPSWADTLPWYQVARSDRHGDLVVDGVVRWNDAAGDYMREDPFPANGMVKYILRGARWADGVGWELEYATGAAMGRRQARLPQQNVRSTVAEYCRRADVLPPATRNWTDVDWLRYASGAGPAKARSTIVSTRQGRDRKMPSAGSRRRS